jgi:hypothetical protein
VSDDWAVRRLIEEVHARDRAGRHPEERDRRGNVDLTGAAKRRVGSGTKRAAIRKSDIKRGKK